MGGAPIDAVEDRLRTIISYDRILVMDSGNIKVRSSLNTPNSI